jgi:methionyl-tRNA formyltransferase
MVRALAALEAGTAQFRKQTEDGLTYAAKITADETRIGWSKPARLVSAHIRGLSPAPGAWFEMPGDPASKNKASVRIKALNAVVEAGSGAPGELLDDRLLIACGEGAVRLTRLQRAGKGPMTAEEFLRGAPAAAGRRLE